MVDGVGVGSEAARTLSERALASGMAEAVLLCTCLVAVRALAASGSTAAMTTTCGWKRQMFSGSKVGSVRDAGGKGCGGWRKRSRAVSGSEGGGVAGFGFWMRVGGVRDDSSNCERQPVVADS